MIWYKFNVRDYLTHTLHLSDAEDLAYRRLLDLYYLSEGPLPLDSAAVARKIRAEEFVTQSVLDEFFQKTPEGYRHVRCEDELARYKSQCEANRLHGAKGGRPKKTESDSEQNPKENKEERRTKYSVLFEEFWSTWPASPRKVGKSLVAQKWAKNNLDRIAPQIIAHVQMMRSSQQWTSGWEPAPLTYVNQRRWEDGETVQMGRRAI